MRGLTTIVVPDATRDIDYGACLEGLAEPGATVIVGLGLHRKMTRDERRPLENACEERGFGLVEHDPNRTVRGVAPEVANADEVICVGVVEPHQYAGFSGGVKAVIIGCGARERIAEMHSLTMLRACQARVGWLAGNPFREKLREFAQDLPLMQGRFVVPGVDGFFDGEIHQAFEEASAASRAHHFVEVEPVGSMLLEVPAAKAVNFYQASRAATYVALSERPAIREGGTLFVKAACPEGVGEGAGERAFAEAMTKGRDQLLRELRSTRPPETRGGAQRAYVLAMAMEHAKIVLVGPDVAGLRSFGIETATQAPDVDLIVEDVFHHVPIAR